MLLESMLSGKDSLCVLSQLVLLRYKTVLKKKCNYFKFSSERKRNRRKAKKTPDYLYSVFAADTFKVMSANGFSVG